MRRILIIGGIFTACMAALVLAQFWEVYRTAGRWGGIALPFLIDVLTLAVIVVGLLAGFALAHRLWKSN
jgi:hypothetical protein